MSLENGLNRTVCVCVCAHRFIQLPSQNPEDWQKRLKSIHLDLCVHAALCEEEFPVVQTLLNLLDITDESNFMFDLYAHVKEIETESQSKALTGLQTVYQSVPERWRIDLSKRKASLFLELLKFQKEKKPVELTDWSVEETEVMDLLQCTPYMSQLRSDECPSYTACYCFYFYFDANSHVSLIPSPIFVFAYGDCNG